MSTFADDTAEKPKAEKTKVEKTKVEVKDIPKEVSDAAKEKVKDLEVKEAFSAAEGEGKIYFLNGSVGDKKEYVKVVVDKDGKVTKAEVKEKKGTKKEEKKEETK